MKEPTARWRLTIGAVLIVLTAGMGTAMAGDSPRPERAKYILGRTDIRRGLIVHVGCGRAQPTGALHAGQHCRVHGLDNSEAEIEAARKHLVSAGLSDAVSVMHWRSEKELPYAAGMVNLLVVEEPRDVSRAEMMRVLAPLGQLFVKRDGKWIKDTKPWPDEIDEWTHYLHDASNNAVASDSRVGPPRHIQWKAGPRWARSHSHSTSMSALVSDGGRIYYIIDEGLAARGGPRFGRWRLCARNAFNGLLLWERKMQEWGPNAWGKVTYWGSPPTLPRRVVAAEGRVFVTLGYRAPVSVLDGSSGRIIKTIEQTAKTDEILWTDGVLIVRRRKKIPDSTGRHTWDTQVDPAEDNGPKIPAPATGEQTVVAVDPESGDTLWEWSVDRIVTLSLAANNGKVCYHNLEEIVCLDLDTGEKLWTVDSPTWPDRMGTAGTLVMYRDMVLYTGDRGLKGISAETGKVKWTGPRIIRSSPWQPPALLVTDGLLWGSLTPRAARCRFPAVMSPYATSPPRPGRRNGRHAKGARKRRQELMESTDRDPDWLLGPEPKGLTPRTGKVERTIPIGNLITPEHHVRCYRAKATEKYLLYNKRGIEFVDITGGGNHARCNWTRGECFYGVMPANGLIYAPPHPCACYPGTLMNGFLAYAADDRIEDASASPTLQKGSAYGSIDKGPKTDSAREWPVYRHDVERSGASDCAVPPGVTESWRTELGTSLTAPVVAGDRVFVFKTDTRTLHCLDAMKGRHLWERTVPAATDTPPTIYEGLVLFGCKDGCVYCLRASDGALVWRFRAAPEVRLIMDKGQLESAWPVHGSIPVIDGLAYVAAGRSSFLDGGIYMYAVKAETGEIVHRTRVRNPRLELEREGGHPYWGRGAKANLLVAGKAKKHIYMSAQKAFTSDLHELKVPHPSGRRDYRQKKLKLHLVAQSGLLDDTRFHRKGWNYTRYWPGQFQRPPQARGGQMLVFDDDTTYALRCGDQLCAVSNAMPVKIKGVVRGFRTRRKDSIRWRRNIPVRVRAMLVAEDVLFAAGPPSVFPTGEPYAALEGQKGGRLWALATENGKTLRSSNIESLPVFDGMAAAYHRLYICTREGSAICLAPPQ